ncbi:MAG: GNAT family N-acetyltransferase [Chloroflexota bacterium]
MTIQVQNPEVHHNPAANRFEIQFEGSIALLEYHLQDGSILFIHTGVPAVLEGRGMGSQLVRAGLEYARQKSLRVVPVCWFVAGYIERHVEYQDML